MSWWAGAGPLPAVLAGPRAAVWRGGSGEVRCALRSAPGGEHSMGTWASAFVTKTNSYKYEFQAVEPGILNFLLAESFVEVIL